MMVTVFQNEYIALMRDESVFYIESMQTGMSLEAFNQLLRDHFPTLKITSFMALRNALLDAPRPLKAFAEDRDPIQLRVTNDGMKAFATLFDPTSIQDPEKIAQTLALLQARMKGIGIVFGLHEPLLPDTLETGREYLIAEGTSPQSGQDSVIQQIPPPASTPAIKQTSNGETYDMSLIVRIEEGQWLGERSAPTPGIPGQSVYGKEIPAEPGKILPLQYDRTTVQESVEEGVTVLRARKAGALVYNGDIVGVFDYREVQGDVGTHTGNVESEGFVSVRGTVENSFSISSERDVEILGDFGVGAAELIQSRAGSIYIRGGIAGQGKAVVQCKRDLFVKFLADVTVECEGTVHIGFYSMNSKIHAKQVVVESPVGKIIGGSVDADIRVEAAEFGNKTGNQTVIHVRGFDRTALKAELEKVKQKLELKRKELLLQRSKLPVTQNVVLKSGRNAKDEYEMLLDEFRELDYRAKALAEYLKTPGEGAVLARKRVNDNVRIHIRDAVLDIDHDSLGMNYVYNNGEIHQL